MILRITFGAMLAFIPAIGILAIWYSGKQRKLERQSAEQARRRRDDQR
jgi:hypothetical protein